MIVHLDSDIVCTQKQVNTFKMNCKKKGQNIFNPDQKRFQQVIRKDHHVIKKIKEILLHKGFLQNRSIGTCVILHSVKGCGRQPWHTDYDPDLCKAVTTKPMGVILALQNNTFFNVYGKNKIHMKKGDIIVFDGDEIHAGSAYTQDNTRIHLYLDTTEVKRMRNKTYLYTDK